MKPILLLALFFSINISLAQNNASQTNTFEISILTIGPGDNLNDVFGHNGFRIKTNYSDVVYDYGRFPFNDPNFYLNFARGKLNYSIGSDNFDAVLRYYTSQNRSIKEQVLNLNVQQKNELLNFLINNAKPKNRTYLYDFFFDNCATKMRDVSQTVLNNSIDFKTPEDYNEESFRELIQKNLNWNTWGSMGIDIALGSVIDKTATPYEYMFLPEYIYQFFDIATFKNSETKLVKNTILLNEEKPVLTSNNIITSPFFIFCILGLLLIAITYSNYKNKTHSKWVDILVFLTTGSIGIFIVLLWFATDHTATAQNYNLLWAFPLNFIALFQIRKAKPKQWFFKYLFFLIIMLCLLTLHWCMGIQTFAPALIPLLIAIGIRYVFLLNHYKAIKKQ